MPAVGAGSGVSDPVEAAARARAKAEFAEWSAFIAYADAECDRIGAVESPRLRRLERSAIFTVLAARVRVSEFQVRSRVLAGRVLRAELPSVWKAFAAGDIDGYKAQLVAEASTRLSDPKHLQIVDESAPGYAASHTHTKLKSHTHTE